MVNNIFIGYQKDTIRKGLFIEYQKDTGANITKA